MEWGHMPHMWELFMDDFSTEQIFAVAYLTIFFLLILFRVVGVNGTYPRGERQGTLLIVCRRA